MSSSNGVGARRRGPGSGVLLSTAAANPVDAAPPRDHAQPAAKRGAVRVEPLRPPPQVDEDILGDVLGGAAVPCGLQRHPVHDRPVRVVHLGQRLLGTRDQRIANPYVVLVGGLQARQSQPIVAATVRKSCTASGSPSTSALVDEPTEPAGQQAAESLRRHRNLGDHGGGRRRRRRQADRPPAAALAGQHQPDRLVRVGAAGRVHRCREQPQREVHDVGHLLRARACGGRSSAARTSSAWIQVSKPRWINASRNGRRGAARPASWTGRSSNRAP